MDFSLISRIASLVWSWTDSVIVSDIIVSGTHAMWIEDERSERAGWISYLVSRS